MSITAPFQRRITNPLQRPLSSDLNLQAFYDSVTQAYMAGVAFSSSPGIGPTFGTGFVGNSFRCFASASTREVVVQKGIGFINAATPYDTENIDSIVGVNAGSYAPVVCQPEDPASAGLYVGIDELGAGLQRIDLVCVKAPNYPTAVESLGILNPASSTFSFAPKPTQFTENAFSVTPGTPDFITVVTGTASIGTPTVPSVPAGYLEIGRVYVPAGDGALSNSEIEDRRPVLIPNGGRSMGLTFRVDAQEDTAELFSLNNGIEVAVRPVYTPLTPTGYSKTFEVYVSSGNTSPSVFVMIPGGFASPLEPDSLAVANFYGMQVSVLKTETVSRASALPVFELAVGDTPVLGPSLAKFTVAVGPLVQVETGSGPAIVMQTQNLDEYVVPDCIARLSLFAQSA